MNWLTKFSVALVVLLVGFSSTALMPAQGRSPSEAKSAVAQEHWAFRPIQQPAVPETAHARWASGPLDCFVLARLEEHGIEPAPRAPRATLIRRLYLDLLGLLPSPEQVAAFVHDPAPDAYERLVDRLLASPRFGERWGRHWLDLARYADTDGYEVDQERPDAWYWRDWVIQAVNSDLPFDEFTIEQLAGDLLPEATSDQILATAFHRQTLTNNEGGIDKEEYRIYAVMDRVNTTATVWLGMTIACTQCHDHPYDAYTQREFYELLAFFNNADEATHQLKLGAEQTVDLAVLLERDEPRATYVFQRGDFLHPQTDETILPATPATLHPFETRRDERPDRLDLARWLMADENPLTARVAVNDVWLRLFGEGLVRTPDDFGVRGEPPTHPQLLDWLAVEYREHNWSRKALIRMIVTSSTYRQAAHRRPELEQGDPLNELLHRQNRLRLDGEIVRDVSLQTAGLLWPRIGGPSVFPPMPQDLTKIDFRSDLKWQVSTGENRYRRGMYTFFKRTLPHPNLMVFDCPDSNDTTVQRQASNTPLQALTTLNNEVFVEAAQAWGAALATSGQQDDAARVDYAFRAALARKPQPAEHQQLVRLLEDSRLAFQDQQAAEQFIGSYRVPGTPAREVAAWTVLAGTLLNLDEFITRE